ncbi:MAG: hypothetical protein HEP71_30935 [Roseivirga sp.]|nr:hypothetical protein [Roseivirga sp.]
MSVMEDDNSIELLEQYTMGNVAYDLLRVALADQHERTNTEESLALFAMAMQSLEMAYWRDEIKKIAQEVN